MPNAAKTVEAPYTAAERLTFLPQPDRGLSRPPGPPPPSISPGPPPGVAPTRALASDLSASSRPPPPDLSIGTSSHSHAPPRRPLSHTIPSASRPRPAAGLVAARPVRPGPMCLPCAYSNTARRSLTSRLTGPFRVTLHILVIIAVSLLCVCDILPAMSSHRRRLRLVVYIVSLSHSPAPLVAPTWVLASDPSASSRPPPPGLSIGTSSRLG